MKDDCTTLTINTVKLDQACGLLVKTEKISPPTALLNCSQMSYKFGNQSELAERSHQWVKKKIKLPQWKQTLQDRDNRGLVDPIMDAIVIVLDLMTAHKIAQQKRRKHITSTSTFHNNFLESWPFFKSLPKHQNYSLTFKLQNYIIAQEFHPHTLLLTCTKHCRSNS